MGGGILANLLRKADKSLYDGLGRLPANSIGMGSGTLKQKLMQRGGNIDDAFATQDLRKLRGRGNLKIRDTGGGGTPLLQDIYAKLTKK